MDDSKDTLLWFKTHVERVIAMRKMQEYRRIEEKEAIVSTILENSHKEKGRQYGK